MAAWNPTLTKPGHSRCVGRRIRRGLQLALLALLADIAFVLAETLVGLKPLSDLQQHPLLYINVFVITVLSFGVVGVIIGSREGLLEDMALRDSLTKLHNSRYLHLRLREELEAATRHGKPTSLVLFDLDHFKRVNDEHGHPTGDELLALIGKAMRGALRSGEIAARVGGEEFAILLARTPIEQATAVAERVRRAVLRLKAPIRGGAPLTVTVSAGVACLTNYGNEDSHTLYRSADRALYRAKREGRNRVAVAS